MIEHKNVAMSKLISLTADIVAAHVSNNNVGVSNMAQLIANVYLALGRLGSNKPELLPNLAPAVSVRASVKNDYIVCLEDGKRLKLLKRHLMTHYKMTPDQYRARWNLPSDYPMVAPAYAQTRREVALKSGLGQKSAVKAATKRPRRTAATKLASANSRAAK